MKRKPDIDKVKCWKCLNARIIISENGQVPLCCLSSQKATDCKLGNTDWSEFVAENWQKGGAK